MEHTNSHSAHNNPSILAISHFGMVLTAGLFSFLGFLIGLDRAPGSFYTYGLTCFLWPILSMVVLGAIVGGSLGFIFGSIAHGSDEPEPIAESALPKTAKRSRNGAAGWPSLHLPRH